MPLLVLGQQKEKIGIIKNLKASISGSTKLKNQILGKGYQLPDAVLMSLRESIDAMYANMLEKT